MADELVLLESARAKRAEANLARPASRQPGTEAAEAGSPRVAATHHGWGLLGQALATAGPLILADLAAIGAAHLIATCLVGIGLDEFPIHFLYRQLAAAVGVSMVLFALFGLYPGTGVHPIVEFRHLILATTAVFCILLIANPTLGRLYTFEAWALTLGWMLALPLVPIGRYLARSQCATRDWWGHPVVIIGNGHSASAAYSSLMSQPYMGLRPIGVLGELHEYWNSDPSTAPPYLGTPDEIEEVARRRGAYWAVITHDALDSVSLEAVASAVPNLLVLPEFNGLPSLWNRSHDFAGRPAIQIQERLLLPLPQLLKRAMDWALVAVIALVAVPLTFVFAVLIKSSSPGPAFYRQRRIGRDGEYFWMWKFRSMYSDADATLEHHLAANPELREEWEQTHKLKDDPRVTRIGKLLRKTSLDELPQLWNVVKGEMSLVGPRPIVDNDEGRPYIEDYPDAYRHYQRVLPGVTGLWQISGRNDTTYDERIQLDSYYIRNWSPWLDLYIVARTVLVVLRGEGAY